MLKSIQVKIVLAFMILGIIIISAMGFTFLKELECIYQSIYEKTGTAEANSIILEQESKTKTIIIHYLLIFSVLG